MLRGVSLKCGMMVGGGVTDYAFSNAGDHSCCQSVIIQC
jgi:hypothetical protein